MTVVDEIAGVASRLAVLLTAGVAPTAALGYVARLDGDTDAAVPTEDADTVLRRGPLARWTARRRASTQGDVDAVIRAVARSARAGVPIGSAISAAAAGLPSRERGAWDALAAAWTVATESGAPLAACLRAIATSLRDIAEVQRELEVALAGPRSTARLVAALPVIAVVFGAIMGFDTVQVLFFSPLGLACLALGVALLVAAWRWNGALVRAAGRADPAPGLDIELVAIAMTGGASVSRARSIVAASGRPVDESQTAEILDLSTRAGVPAVELLRAEAEQRRREARSAGRERAATAAVQLMLPLSVCVLPSFMLLGVAPLLIAVVTSTFDGLA
ncbi:type II secretion system F family protein [Agromyces atrinae]|uniref:type II secretion system F family protein n=1 Tax=Agromyces atrinae TaxID=592376 RepID=UPI001F5936BC|nr:type II secretion system F family protein [Agromyces atrinae]MCI2959663.1 type II secretion system F family protein [Agromyces atrinae]